MKIRSMLFGALALAQATSLSANNVEAEAKVQQTAVGFSIDVGPGGCYYDDYGYCFDAYGNYIGGPGCQYYYYYYGPRYDYYRWHRPGRRWHGHHRRHHGGGRHHGRHDHHGGGRRGRR